MSANNLFSGKDLLRQISEFYHELKRIEVGSKTPVEEEAEKEVNNVAESPQQDSKLLIPNKLKSVIEKSTFPKDVRANPPTPQCFPYPRDVKNAKAIANGRSPLNSKPERTVLQEDSCSSWQKHVAQLHAQLLITGSLSHSPSTTCLLKCLTEVSSVSHSYVLGFFSRIPDPSTFQWDTIIWACSSHHFPRESLNLFRKMRQKSMTLDTYTFQFMFKSCGLAGSALEGQMVHALFVKHFPDCDVSIDMKDVVSWTTIIGGLMKSRFMDDARKLFNEMPMRHVVSWTSLIADHAKDGRASKAVWGVQRDEIVIDKRIGVSSNLVVALINMYAKGGSIKSARQIFDSMNNKIAPAWNAIIDGYGKISDIDIARSLFEKINAPNIISFNSMITEYIHGGRLNESLQLFSKLRASGLQPDKFTVVSLLTTYASLGSLSQGKILHPHIEECFVNQMSLDFNCHCPLCGGGLFARFT
ncbi:putative pentatricopeptide repeat-containing protein At5g37570 [Zingiber officinale]|uniref:putative pentatricopeptide repeat-containing protein At5g37570 n=1 Tax=Zingiber officinale TaxID=94328 RepID=UPI001C4ADC9A|nr:putative pentatricopeptide repeat-containing protein At5g37570 [Zingiber officinale]